MIFSKANKIPDGLDYDKTVSKLLKLGWLSEIFDVESNKSIYQITDFKTITSSLNKKLRNVKLYDVLIAIYLKYFVFG